MNGNTQDLEQSDEDILTFEVSDEALEAAASTRAGAAMSPAAPTVSILVVCCCNDGNTAPERDKARW